MLKIFNNKAKNLNFKIDSYITDPTWDLLAPTRTVLDPTWIKLDPTW
jgi:hypothetical protein